MLDVAELISVVVAEVVMVLVVIVLDVVVKEMILKYPPELLTERPPL